MERIPTSARIVRTPGTNNFINLTKKGEKSDCGILSLSCGYSLLRSWAISPNDMVPLLPIRRRPPASFKVMATTCNSARSRTSTKGLAIGRVFGMVPSSIILMISVDVLASLPIIGPTTTPGLMTTNFSRPAFSAQSHAASSALVLETL